MLYKGWPIRKEDDKIVIVKTSSDNWGKTSQPFTALANLTSDSISARLK